MAASSNNKENYNYDVERLFVIYPYRAKKKDELSVSFGDEVIPLKHDEYAEFWLVAYSVPEKDGNRLQGLVPRLHLTKGFYKFSWFVGTMNTEEAINELMGNENREFLIRISDFKRPTEDGLMGQLVFSYKDKDAIRHSTVHHLKEMDGKGYFYVTCIDTINCTPFVDYYSATLKDLVTYLQNRLSSGQLYLASQVSLLPSKNKIKSEFSSEASSSSSYSVSTVGFSDSGDIVKIEKSTSEKQYKTTNTKGLKMMIVESEENTQAPPKPPRNFEVDKMHENQLEEEIFEFEVKYSERPIDVPEFMEREKSATKKNDYGHKHSDDVLLKNDDVMSEIDRIITELDDTIFEAERKNRDSEDALTRLKETPFTVSATRLHNGSRNLSPSPIPAKISQMPQKITPSENVPAKITPSEIIPAKNSFSGTKSETQSPGISLISEELTNKSFKNQKSDEYELSITRKAEEVPYLRWEEEMKPRLTVESVDSCGSPVNKPLWLSIPPSVYEEVITLEYCELQGKSKITLSPGIVLLIKGEEKDRILVQKIEDGEMGYLPKSKVSESVSKMSWNLGKVSRIEGDNRFADISNPVGSFYIRQKSSTEWVLTVKSSHRGICDHYRITWKDGYYILSNDLFFQSLHLLVDYCTENKFTRRSKRLPFELKEVASSNNQDQEKSPSKIISVTQRRVALMEKISLGTYAEIYIARLDGYEQVTAKVLECKEIARFKRESDLLSQFDHGNIVKIKATCFSQPPYLFLMEFMNRSLHDLLKLRPLNQDFGEFDNIAGQICSAMKYIQSRNIVHRNLKSSNVLCNNAENCPPKVKLADFSLAVFEGEKDETDLSRLPAFWTPPEILKGNQAAKLSDVWSFGVLLYEMINQTEVKYPGAH
ncbi:hypothetical protein WR25_04243 isoform E [Diploscapter pachys]|uniref:Tyrosine-protein kinase n=1 Tax=Diploscapter pachys TaxID=2018661 RepID=A0A2A2K1I8_9BILA|nr:hypothetical protein WR25_04243 isoform E [Diploscapter pachys]